MAETKIINNKNRDLNQKKYGLKTSSSFWWKVFVGFTVLITIFGTTLWLVVDDQEVKRSLAREADFVYDQTLDPIPLDKLDPIDIYFAYGYGEDMNDFTIRFEVSNPSIQFIENSFFDLYYPDQNQEVICAPNKYNGPEYLIDRNLLINNMFLEYGPRTSTDKEFASGQKANPLLKSGLEGCIKFSFQITDLAKPDTQVEIIITPDPENKLKSNNPSPARHIFRFAIREEVNFDSQSLLRGLAKPKR